MRFYAGYPRNWCLVLVATAVILGNRCCEGNYMDNQKKLYREKMQGYEKTLIPLENEINNVTLYVDLLVTSFDNLDEKRHRIFLTAWLRQRWNDFQWTWNPDDYGGIKELEVGVQDVWSPDVGVLNSRQAGVPYSTINQKAIVQYDGWVNSHKIININAGCPIDLTHFPYDSQTCYVNLGSWVYYGNKLNITTFPDLDINMTRRRCLRFLPAADWKVVDCNVTMYSPPYMTTPYWVYMFTLTVERVSTFASHLFVTPSIILSFLMLVTFLLPAASKEKIVLGIGLLISNVLLLGELINYVPAAYKTLPLIGKYFVANIVLSSLTLLSSAAVINMWSRSTTRINGPPNFIRLVALDYVAKWLLVSDDQFCDSLEDGGTDTDSNINAGDDMETSNKARLRQAQIYVRKIVRLQWRQLATVIDRILIIVYFIIVLVLTLMFTQYM